MRLHCAAFLMLLLLSITEDAYRAMNGKSSPGHEKLKTENRTEKTENRTEKTEPIGFGS
jgi:hypothetical protein